ncbi:peptidoglycan-binding domain-containing protein [Rivularia sp. UHCC 0363]|uniref:peptidoglycan-binding domain-containing protein n=1 Tax=Rivularia sp. UHCC 0363 TaxID=3110244 RepID=UPI002B219001|nr:peptidoglycan-binding protein [Rivularia sp. UHCC 0363]MEA5592976.1 peptidoglycan-binding protein [Rivularia sp. UHCC 0363]
MNALGSDYQNLVKEAPLNKEAVPVKVDFKLFVNICGKMFDNNRFTLPLISLVTTLTMLGSSSEVFAQQKGDNNSQVKNVQSCLKKLGYFNGPVNGNFGSMTETAVKKFQQANKIPAIGNVGPQTQAALQRKCGGGSGNRGSSSNSNSNSCQNELRSGCSGPAVTKLQQDLKALGIYNGPVTGRFLQLTTDAVIKFQRQKGINPIGVVGPQTSEAIRLARNNSSPSQGQGRYCDHNREVITIGCRSDWVRQLQQTLKGLSYFGGNPTGYFGSETRDAVIRFQQTNRLPVTGTVDDKTWGAIIRASNRPPLTTPPLTTSIMQLGSRGSEVTTLQQDLKRLNYFYGNPTGFFDNSTQDAVIRFQQAYRLPATGTVDQNTSQAIATVLRSSGGGSDFEPIYPQQNNQRVTKLQERLVELGLLKVNPTGYFGTQTREGLLAFQRYQGLPETGFVDEQTWEKLGFNSSREKRYVVVIPLRNPDILNQVRQDIPTAEVGKSRLGDYVNAGEFDQRLEAQRQSDFLRDRGFDARVEFF